MIDEIEYLSKGDLDTGHIMVTYDKKYVIVIPLKRVSIYFLSFNVTISVSFSLSTFVLRVKKFKSVWFLILLPLGFC